MNLPLMKLRQISPQIPLYPPFSKGDFVAYGSWCGPAAGRSTPPFEKGGTGGISRAAGNPEDSREGGVSFLIESGRSDQEIREKLFGGIWNLETGIFNPAARGRV